MQLSVIIITKNEAANIGACLDSVAFAHEWIVVDSGSTDGTVDLARTWGATVIETLDWPGFGAQKIGPWTPPPATGFCLWTRTNGSVRP